LANAKKHVAEIEENITKGKKLVDEDEDKIDEIA